MNAPGPDPSGQLPPSYAATYAPPAWAPPQRSWRQWQAYARAHLESDRPVEQLYAEMAMAGMSQADGRRLVREITGAMRKRALLILGFGGLMILVGLALVFGASELGRRSSSLAWWFGIVLSGFVSAGRGIYELSRIPKV